MGRFVARERKPISVRAKAKCSFIHGLARHRVVLSYYYYYYTYNYDTTTSLPLLRHSNGTREGVPVWVTCSTANHHHHQPPWYCTPPNTTFLAFLPKEFRILLLPTQTPQPPYNVRSSTTLTLKLAADKSDVREN